MKSMTTISTAGDARGKKRKAKAEKKDRTKRSQHVAMLKRFKPFGMDFNPEPITASEAIIGVFKSDSGDGRVVTGTLTRANTLWFRCRDYTSHLSIRMPPPGVLNTKSDELWDATYDDLSKIVKLRDDVDLSSHLKLVDYIIDQTDKKDHPFKSGSDAQKFEHLGCALSLMEVIKVDSDLTGTDDLTTAQLGKIAQSIARLSSEYWRMPPRSRSSQLKIGEEVTEYITASWKWSVAVLETLIKSRNGAEFPVRGNWLNLDDEKLKLLGLKIEECGTLNEIDGVGKHMTMAELRDETNAH